MRGQPSSLGDAEVPPDRAVGIGLGGPKHPDARAAAIPLVFAATLFLSAALLFLLEPMFAKMVLPYLGGSPAVWNTCVVFFQATMLTGYGYAHVLTRWVPIRTQVIAHIALMVAVTRALPITIPEGWTPPVDRTPVPALLFLLLVTVG